MEGDILSLENFEKKVFISRNRKAKFMEDLTNFVATYGGKAQSKPKEDK